MQERTRKIREIAKKLLSEKKVDVVLGHRKGTVPLKSAPYFAHTPEEADALVWDGNCRSNLANFLPGVKGKRVAIVAQGCVSRNVVGLIVENQAKREDVYIIGVPCMGMLNRDAVLEAVPGELTGITEINREVGLIGPGFEIKKERKSLLRETCLQCLRRNPVLFDELVVEKVPEQESSDRYAEIRAIEAMNPEEKSRFMDGLLGDCIRCYACRDACPLCYCPECFVDKFSPQWCGKSMDGRDVLSYHLVRALHTAGRCTECGACEDACPMGIKVRLITSKVEKDIKENFDGREAWDNLDAQPPLVGFKIDDPQPFVK